MTSNPYETFQGSDLILRDELAIDRTVLANERTLLSYIRTGLAFGITGAGTIKFVASLVGVLVGWCWIVVSLLVVAFVCGVSGVLLDASQFAGSRRYGNRQARFHDGLISGPPNGLTTST